MTAGDYIIIAALALADVVALAGAFWPRRGSPRQSIAKDRVHTV